MSCEKLQERLTKLKENARRNSSQDFHSQIALQELEDTCRSIKSFHTHTAAMARNYPDVKRLPGYSPAEERRTDAVLQANDTIYKFTPELKQQ